MKKTFLSLVLTGLLALSLVGSAFALNPNPRVIPNEGPNYGRLGAQWWQWAFSFPMADIPFTNEGGAVDISAGQSGNVWFLAGQGWGMDSVTRTGTIPTGRSLFLPLINLINDYPCPDPTFVPNPGETLEEFLLRTGNESFDLWFAPDPSLLFAEVDGVSLTGLPNYRAASSLFTFTADPALAAGDPPFDPCITGTEQYGVAIGYWLWLPPLTPGTHTLHFGYTGSQDVTYVLTVTPGRRPMVPSWFKTHFGLGMNR